MIAKTTGRSGSTRAWIPSGGSGILEANSPEPENNADRKLLCGNVAYEVDAAPGRSFIATASHAGRPTAQPSRRSANVPRERFAGPRARGLLRGFEILARQTRYFCTQCGSHIVAERAGTGMMLLRIGLPGYGDHGSARMHTGRSEAASWYDRNATAGMAEDPRRKN